MGGITKSVVARLISRSEFDSEITQLLIGCYVDRQIDDCSVNERQQRDRSPSIVDLDGNRRWGMSSPLPAGPRPMPILPRSALSSEGVAASYAPFCSPSPSSQHLNVGHLHHPGVRDARPPGTEHEANGEGGGGRGGRGRGGFAGGKFRKVARTAGLLSRAAGRAAITAGAKPMQQQQQQQLQQLQDLPKVVTDDSDATTSEEKSLPLHPPSRMMMLAPSEAKKEDEHKEASTSLQTPLLSSYNA